MEKGERACAQACQLRATGAQSAGTDRPQKGHDFVAQRAQQSPTATLVRHFVLELRRWELWCAAGLVRRRRSVGLFGRRRVLKLRGGGGERVVGRLLKAAHRVA